MSFFILIALRCQGRPILPTQQTGIATRSGLDPCETTELPSQCPDPRLTSAEPKMIRAALVIATAAALIPVAARAQDPCSLLTPDQIKAVINSPVEPGQPGVAKGSDECTWGDANGDDRVYIALRPAPLRTSPASRAVTPACFVRFRDNRRSSALLQRDRKMAGFLDFPDQRIAGLPKPTGDKELSPRHDKSLKEPRIVPISTESRRSHHCLGDVWRRVGDSNPR